MPARLATLIGLIFLTAIGSACGSDDAAGPYRVDGPSQSASADVHVYRSIEELTARTDLVAEVTPVRRMEDWWDESGMFVAMQFVLRVDSVISGDVKPGSEIVVFIPGGTVAQTFPVHESRMPREGVPSMEEQYADYPPYRMGVQEVGFLQSYDNPDYPDHYIHVAPFARFHVVKGALQSVVPDDVVVQDPYHLRQAIEAVPAAQLATFVAAARSRPIPIVTDAN